MPGAQFILQGAKRIFDAKALYAQLVITDDCNLSCDYCNEYIPGAPPIPLATLQRASTSSRPWGCWCMTSWGESRCYIRTWPL